MWGKVWRAAIAAAVITGAGSTAAFAADGSYVPDTPDESGVNGSVVQSLCVRQAPAIDYTIVRVDASAAARTASAGDTGAELVLTGEGHRMVVPLDVDAAGEGSGTVLWPGVEVGSDGAVDALPGWVRSGDQWAPRDDAAAWTTGDIAAELHVGDRTISVPLSYPGYSDECATPVGVASSTTEELAVTGGQLPFAAAIGGAAAVAAGLLLLVRRRRHVEES